MNANGTAPTIFEAPSLGILIFFIKKKEKEGGGDDGEIKSKVRIRESLILTWKNSLFAVSGTASCVKDSSHFSGLVDWDCQVVFFCRDGKVGLRKEGGVERVEDSG